MQIRTLRMSSDGVSNTGDLIELCHEAPGHLTLNGKPVLHIFPFDTCTLALTLPGETRYIVAQDYWRAVHGAKGVVEREAGCLLARLDMLALRANAMLEALEQSGALQGASQDLLMMAVGLREALDITHTVFRRS